MLPKRILLLIAALAVVVVSGQAFAGANANAVLSLDLIPGGGAGNRTDDGVTRGTVSGRGATIAVEVFATGVRTSLAGMILNSTSTLRCCRMKRPKTARSPCRFRRVPSAPTWRRQVPSHWRLPGFWRVRSLRPLRT